MLHEIHLRMFRLRDGACTNPSRTSTNGKKEKMKEELKKVIQENEALKKRCAWLEGQLDLRYQQLDSLNKQARTLAEWLARSNTCPYPDDYDCPRLHHGMCFASDEIMCGCWLDASARSKDKLHAKT